MTATASAEGTITLAWNDAASETGYRIERSANSTTGWTQIGTAAANAVTYSDAGLPENIRYYYRVIATNAAGDSAPQHRSTPSPLATPAALPPRSSRGARSISTWTDRSSVGSTYSIDQSLDGVNWWSQVGTALANATSFHRFWTV